MRINAHPRPYRHVSPFWVSQSQAPRYTLDWKATANGTHSNPCYTKADNPFQDRGSPDIVDTASRERSCDYAPLAP